MVSTVIVVPQLGDDEDLFTLDEPFFDGTLDALACFVLILVVVCTVEQAVADFDGLVGVSLLSSLVMMFQSRLRCRLYRPLVRLGLSKDQSLREASRGRKST